MAVFWVPERSLLRSDSQPMAVLQALLLALVRKASHPRAELVLSVQPKTLPAAVGVAALALAAPHFTPVVQVESAIRACPFVPTASGEGVLAALAARIVPFAL